LLVNTSQMGKVMSSPGKSEGGGDVKNELKNIGAIVEAVSSVAHCVSDTAKKVAENGKQVEVKDKEETNNSRTDTVERAVFSITPQLIENENPISIDTTRTTIIVKDTKPTMGSSKHTEGNSKEESNVSAKIIESGKQMIMINTEIIKTNSEELGKNLQKGVDGKQNMMVSKEESNITNTNVLNGIQNEENETKETSVGVKIVESENQMVEINKELIKPNSVETKGNEETEIKNENDTKHKKKLESNKTTTIITSGNQIKENKRDVSIMATSIVDSGKQMLVINNEVTKIKSSTNNKSQESFQEQKIVEISKTGSNKTSKSIKKEKQMMANGKESITMLKNEDTKKETLTKKDEFEKSKAIQKGNKKTSGSNKEDKSIAKKIIESGKQILGINNKLAKSKNLKESELESKENVTNLSTLEILEEGPAKKDRDDKNSTGTVNPIYVQEPDKNLLKDKFKLFSKFGDKSSDGSTIKLSQSDKWFKEAGLMKVKGISPTDTSIAFRKLSKRALKINFLEWNRFLDEIARAKLIDGNKIRNKLMACGDSSSYPGRSGTAHSPTRRVSDRKKKESVREPWKV